MKKTCKVLVYGSLRRNERAHRYLEGATFLGEKRVPGFDLYHLQGWFPGIKRNPKNKEGVLCEQYEVPKSVVKNLDDFEGFFPKYPKMSLFLREKVEEEDSFIYVYNGSIVESVEHIVETGDWSTR